MSKQVKQKKAWTALAETIPEGEDKETDAALYLIWRKIWGVA